MFLCSVWIIKRISEMGECFKTIASSCLKHRIVKSNGQFISFTTPESITRRHFIVSPISSSSSFFHHDQLPFISSPKTINAVGNTAREKIPTTTDPNSFPCIAPSCCLRLRSYGLWYPCNHRISRFSQVWSRQRLNIAIHMHISFLWVGEKGSGEALGDADIGPCDGDVFMTAVAFGVKGQQNDISFPVD